MGTSPGCRAWSTGASGGLAASGHPPHWPQGRAEISLFRAFLPRLCRSPFPCELGALGGPAGMRELGTALASPKQGLPSLAIPCHARRPSQARNHRIDTESLYPLPRNHQIKSVPLKRTEKCRFPRFGRSSYTCLILPVFPRFPRGALIAQNNPKSLPTGWTLCREPEERGRRHGPRLFPS